MRAVAGLPRYTGGGPARETLRTPGGLRTLLVAGMAVFAFASLALLVHRYDAAPVLGVLSILAAAVALLAWPELGMLLAVFLLYTNLPFTAAKAGGISEGIAALVILLVGLPILQHVVLRRGGLRVDRSFLLLLLFLTVLLVSALAARGPSIAIEYIQKFVLEGLLLYFLVINAVRSLSTLRRVIWTALAAGALLAGLSVYQEVTGSFDQQFGGLAQRNFEYLELQRQLALFPDDEGLLEQLSRHGTGDRSRRAEGPMDEPNRYGQILVVLLPLAFYACRTAGSRAGRLGGAGAGLLLLGGILASQSRGTFLALALLLLLCLFLKWIRPAHLLISVLVLLPLTPIVAPGVIERARSIATALDLVRRDETMEADGAIRGRATAMLAAYHVFLDHPALGVGPGQYPPFYSVEYQQKDPRRKFRDLPVPRRAHSLYFEMAAELGVIGLGVFLSIILLLLRDLWCVARFCRPRCPASADLAIAFCLALVAYMATAVFLHLAFARYFWFLLALAGAALLAIRASERDARRDPA